MQGKGSMVAVLTYDYWQRTFDGAADVVGKTVRIDNATMTVVGVLPPHFTGIKDLDMHLVVPFNSDRTNSGALYLLGRLRGGTTMTELESQLRTVWATAFDEGRCRRV